MIEETEQEVESGRFTVESTDVEGAKLYDGVLRDVLSDLNLARAIGRLHIYIDPKQPVFIAVGLFRQGLPTLTLGDVADISGVNEGLLVSVRDEEYAATAVGKLYLKYGRDQLIPTDRTAVIVPTKGDYATQHDEIAAIVVYDPKEELKKSVIDALIRITPEGFRVRKHYISEHMLAFIASEDPIRPEWMDTCRMLRQKINSEREE